MNAIPAGYVLQPDGSYSKPRPARNVLEQKWDAFWESRHPKKKTRRAKLAPAVNPYLTRFVLFCTSHGFPVPVPEFAFAAPERKFRADFAFVKERILVEIDGGIFRKGGGAHSHPTSILRDMDKINEATRCGYRVLRFTPKNFTGPDAASLIRDALKIV